MPDLIKACSHYNGSIPTLTSTNTSQIDEYIKNH